MENYVIILIGIIVALLIVGGAVAYKTMHTDNNNNTTVQSCIPNITNETDDTASTATTESQSSSQGPEVVNETVKFNAQQGSGYYRQVDYSDGNMRQYDVDTGKLIGSTYDSDQDQLPSME